MNGPRPSPPEAEPVDVCICTFRRPSLADTLRSVARQSGVSGGVRVIVADNDDTPSAFAVVEAARRDGLDIHYVHAPARNISVARNACLEAAKAPLLAFIDDDETADPLWLSELTAAMAASPDLAAVFGPVRAVYPSEAPRWAQEADLHSISPVVTRRGVDTGYTSNAMVRRSVVEGWRFDVALGGSGGEDTDLFTRLYSTGARYGVAPAALVSEAVAPDRLNMRWLSRRAFRSGQTHARRFLGAPPTRLRAAALAAAKASACLLLTLARLGSSAGWRRAWVRACLHAGAASRLFGKREGRLYG